MKIIFFTYFCTCYLATEIRSYRLSTDVTPSFYSIKIRPDIENDVFDGDVSIYVRARSILNKITLHAVQLNVSEAYINNIRSTVQSEDNETISLQYENDSIQPGEHILRLKYVGVLQNNGTGFLKAPYRYNDEEGFILVTDFEPNRARKAFPCFDEPSFKARYSIRLVAPDNTYNAISNMPAINQFTTPNGVVYDFATSLPMSTYLVSFAITQYPYYEDIFEDGDRRIPIRVHTYNASKENNEFAINCTKTALQFYTEYTNISYPLSKLDMTEYIRPESAATENWGLITFREGLLSLNLGNFDGDQIQAVIYHEICHFWFGNLVTNDWWNDIWLQEGFATYMSYKLYTKVSAKKKTHDERVFFFDAFVEIKVAEPSNPLVSYLRTEDQVPKKFDLVVYDKGAAMLLMIESVIGEEAFQKVVRTYLKKYAYKTATTNDFLSTIDEVVPDISLRAFIESYIYQNRFPIVSVDGDNGTFVLKQEICKTAANFSEIGQKWTIPITYITDKNKNPTLIWFDKDVDTLTIEVPEAKWIMLNSKGNGLYKVQFSKKAWDMLTRQFKEFTLEESELLALNAAYAFQFGLINCDVVLNLMKQVHHKKQWSFFAEFHLVMEQRLRCNNYKEELTSYVNFLNKRLNETSYPRRTKLKRDACVNGEGTLNTEKQKESLRICAKWISENLSTSINDVTHVF